MSYLCENRLSTMVIVSLEYWYSLMLTLLSIVQLDYTNLTQKYLAE